ncbi:TonB-dependent receptor [Sinomicrobium kalidii]|uniref:SusC/RagA family TonB-linked outer membrane protein n=1 Tax=Sinomicrobium kalidii TaxID=2900738 RepID=UPI001E4E1565|nr:TonB-dependent receptor [Sinomicrobium kalidii]UGU15864.1 TonB-dependent receptor [Sinomicrobium kalidii]
MSNRIKKRYCLQPYYYKIHALLLMSFFTVSTYGQEKRITGQVLDANHVPVPGVNILIEETATGTQTDFDGNFSIRAGTGDVLKFSYIGMKTRKITVKDETHLEVIMEEDALSLNDVVVVGYGTQKKSDLISSVASVKPEDMTRVATTDIGEMLRGKAAGVQVTLGSGGPGSTSDILIRGKNSINGGNAPLVIADGVPVGNINDINPNDIASLEILKDAAAQAIYGARASNGVILITTKRGEMGKTTISYNGFSGIQFSRRNFDIYNGDEFADLKREAFRTSNLGEYLPDEAVFSDLELESVQNREYIDWEDLLIRTGTIHNHNLSISSGNEKTKIYSGFNYINQQGIIPNSGYEKVTARINADQQVTDWLKIGVNTSYQFSKDKRPNVGNVLLTSITTAPLGKVYNEDGSLRLYPGGYVENVNPLVNLRETKTVNENRNDIFNVFADLSLLEGLHYRLNASRRSYNGKRTSYNSGASISGIANDNRGNGSIRFQDNVEWQLENILTYDYSSPSEKSKLNITLVNSITESEFNEFTHNFANVPNDILDVYGLESAEISSSFISGNRRGLVSFAGRVQYDYDSRYYLTLSARADASTVFGKNNKWGYFPAAAAGWNIHREAFLENSGWVNNLKLRVSYGSVGNEGISPYQSLSTAEQRDYITAGNKVSGYVPGSYLPNPDLKWETSTTLNTALDIGLWHNRLTATVELYDTRTKNLLIDQALNAGTGYTRKKSNIGEVENNGIDLSLSGDVIRNDELKITLGVLFSRNNNKIRSLYGKDEDGDGREDDDVANGWFIGQPIDVYYQYKAVGIWQEGENIAGSHQPDAMPGDIKLFDRHPDDGELNAENDRVLTSRVPDWYGTFSLNAEYGGVDMSVDVTTVQGVVRNNPFLYGYTEGGSLRGIKNGIKQDYWTPENPEGKFPRPDEANDPDRGYALGLQDASYVRLQNVTLGYTLPDNITETIGLNRLRLYMTGSNLLTVTDFESYSPEKNPGEYPESVSVVAGVQVSF